MKRVLGAATVVVALTVGSMVAATAARAQPTCGNDVSDPCGWTSSWASTYSQADLFRMQEEQRLVALRYRMIQSLVEASGANYRGAITYIR